MCWTNNSSSSELQSLWRVSWLLLRGWKSLAKPQGWIAQTQELSLIICQKTPESSPSCQNSPNPQEREKALSCIIRLLWKIKKRCPANLSQVKLGCINLVVVSTGAQLCESPLMQGSVGLRRKSILTDISFLYSGRILANTDGNSSQWLKMFSGTCIKFRQNSSQVSLQGYKTPKQVVVIHTLKYGNQLTLVSRSCWESTLFSVWDWSALKHLDLFDGLELSLQVQERVKKKVAWRWLKT